MPKGTRKKGMLPLGFPKQQTVKLRYVENVSIDPAAAGIDKYDFRANSCFDPNKTGVGHQPYLWDEWAQFYNHYVVLGSKISIQAAVDSTSNQSPVVLGIYLSDDSTTSTSFTSLCEKGMTHYKVIPQGRQTVAKLDFKYSTKDYFNVVDVKDNLDRLGAQITADPPDQAHYIIYAAALDGLANPSKVDMLVTIDYIVAFSEPKENASS